GVRVPGTTSNEPRTPSTGLLQTGSRACYHTIVEIATSPPKVGGPTPPNHPPSRPGARMPLDLLTRLDPLRRIRCPFCFERFAACEMHLRCNDHYCKTDFARMIEDPILSQALNGRRRGGSAGSALRSPWWV